jgi:hypothetical protein
LETPVNTISPSTGIVRPSETIAVTPLQTSTLLATLPPTNLPNATRPTPTWIVDNHPDLSIVFSSPNLVTDGKLLLDIAIAGHTCYHRGETIYIITDYHNSTYDEDLILVDFDYISRKQTSNAYGQLFPIMTTLDSREVYPDVLFIQDDVVNPRSPLTEVARPQSILQFYAPYQIPKEIGEKDKDHNLTFSPLPVGKYFLKFVYIAKEYEGSWYGAISSNQIEICVVD